MYNIMDALHVKQINASFDGCGDSQCFHLPDDLVRKGLWFQLLISILKVNPVSGIVNPRI